MAMQKEAVKSFAWAAASFGGGRLFVFVSTLVLARLLTPRDFGVVAVALTLSMYLEIALDLGVGSTLVYEQGEGIGPRVHTAFTLSLGVGLVLTGLGFLVAPAAAELFGASGEEAIFRAVFVYLFIRGAGEVQDAVLKRDLQFKKRTVAELLNGVVRAIVSIALAVMGAGAWAIVGGLLSGALVGTAARWVLVGFHPRLRFDRAAASTLLGFGMTVVGLKVLGTIAENFDYLIVGNRLGATELGYYSIAYRLPELLIANVYWVFSTVAFPIYSKARATDPESFATAMLKALRFTTLFGFSVGLGLAIAARDLVPILFGAKWAPAILPMTLLSIALGAYSVGYASGDIFPAIGKPGLLLRTNLAVVAAMFVGFVLAANYGLAAVATVHLITAIVYAVIRIGIANRLLHTTVRQSIASMRPAFWSAAGIALLALPARLLLDSGPVALVVIVAAGVIGAIGGLALGAPGTIPELRMLARHALSR